MSDPAYLEGYISVRAALEAGSRPVESITLRRDKRDPEAAWLENAARRIGIPLEHAETAVIDALVGGSTHGGVVARVGLRRFLSLDEIAAGQASPFVAMLDGVEDPFNFGQAVRALYAAGAHGLIVRPRNWTSAAGVVARASAGASEWMPLAVAETVEHAAQEFRRRGLRVAVATTERATPLYDADLTGPLLVVIGGEKRGITRSFVESADLRLIIPYGRGFDYALGTAPAASVIAFEVMRQRRVQSDVS